MLAFIAFVRAKVHLLAALETAGRDKMPRESRRQLTRLLPRRVGAARPAVPFGWTVRRHYYRNAFELGPWWYLAARGLLDRARHRFYFVMLYKLKWAYEPHEGGYYHEIKWRFIEETRWPE